jgi:hypothetical protein
MSASRYVVVGGLLLLGIGCQVDQSLGDIEEAGGEAGDASGGSDTMGGAAGSSGSGATSGGSTGGGASASGGTGPGTGGRGGATSGGGGTGGSSGACFSPDENPELGLDPSAIGCACDEEPGVCVALEDGPGFHLVAMLCSGGRWNSVEDGPCEPNAGQRCLIGNRLYRQGESFRDPFSCNECACGMNGSLSCTLIGCDIPCPAGTVEGRRCRACGSPGGCDIWEIGCFDPCVDGELCEFGFCDDGVCSVGPCI